MEEQHWMKLPIKADQSFCGGAVRGTASGHFRWKLPDSQATAMDAPMRPPVELTLESNLAIELIAVYRVQWALLCHP